MWYKVALPQPAFPSKRVSPPENLMTGKGTTA
jgi:hypothetical protein